ncbi:NAD-dependent epimerase/dehydratase family protein [Ramlibacter algicola]|uniref:NAD-dependent epimerase/dehydratase domain-containing protein n=1 Tax=Ramlibacter algicola TaxID=2795217 RepID=A0A934UQ76_9BURK|nr:NAD-dependent epimerase/dehydratase family protein [Ramlibacter algicola]MBK0392319.1 hypothetical protein [Ramlibacter algicola]
MRLLFVGGTRFSGLAAVRIALERGHQVDVFHRGKSKPEGLAGAREILGDRHSDLQLLARGEWDAVVDTCGFRPGEVHQLADALDRRAGHYTFISSGSVYALDVPAGPDESARLATTDALDPATLDTVPIDGDNYGPLKVLSERAAQARFASCALLRPTYIVGPGDYTQRFPEWVRRLAAGGRVTAPGPRDAAIQHVDARDLGAFIVDAAERRLQGPFNVAAQRGPFSFGDMLEGIAGAVAPAGTTIDWITPEQARASGQEFPLWHGGETYGFASMDTKVAYAAGLQCRPLHETVVDTLAWVRAAGHN